MEQISILLPVDSLSITMLMDNVTDMLVMDQGPAKRFGLASSGEPPMREARTLEGGRTIDQPLAEHGFSALITVDCRTAERTACCSTPA